MSRRLLIIATIAAGLTVVAIQLVMQRLASEPQALPASIHRVGKANEPLPTLWPVPSYRLVDQNGQTRTPEDLRGSVWIADFIFTSCKSVCPVLSAKMVQLQRAIPDPRMKFVSFSVDPDRDTPQAVQAFSAAHGLGSNWFYLVGARAQLTPVWASYGIGVQAGSTTVTHNDAVYLIDARGRERLLLHSEDLATALTSDLRALLKS